MSFPNKQDDGQQCDTNTTKFQWFQPQVCPTTEVIIVRLKCMNSTWEIIKGILIEIPLLYAYLHMMCRCRRSSENHGVSRPVVMGCKSGSVVVWLCIGDELWRARTIKSTKNRPKSTNLPRLSTWFGLYNSDREPNFSTATPLLSRTVPTNEIGTVYQFWPILTRRLMALRVFSFYFLISKLVAVILRLLEGGGGPPPPFMYISLPPGTGAMCTNFAKRKFGQLPCFSYGATKKRALFKKIIKKNSRKTYAIVVLSKRWRISQSSFSVIQYFFVKV